MRAKILTVNTQGVNLFLWALVDTEYSDIERTIYIHGTGHEMINPLSKYINTVFMENGKLVFHIFEAL